MKSLKFILLIITLVSCTKKTQTTNSLNDSVEKYLQLASNDKLPFDVRDKYNKKALRFNYSAYKLVVKSPNNQKNRNLLSEISYVFFKSQELDKVKESANILLKKAKETKDTIMIAKSYRYIGSYYKNMKINDSSFYYYIKAKKIYKKYKLEDDYYNIVFFESIVKYNIGDYTGADLGLRNAYNYFKKNNNLERLNPISTQLGLTNNELKEYDKAVEYLNESLKITLLSNNKYLKSLCYNNLGLIYNNSKDYKKGIENFNLALRNKAIQKDDPELYGHLLDNLGFSYLKLGGNFKLPKLFYQSLKIRDSLGDKPAVIVTNNHLSEYYELKKDTTKALYFAKKALAVAIESKDPNNMILALRHVTKVDKLNASKYSEDYIRISDSLQLEERKSKDRFARIELETDEITQEKEKAIKQKWVQTSIIAAVLIIVILLFIIFKQRSQKKEFVLIQNQQKANEEIYQLMLNQQAKEEEAKQKEKKRIALELHDNVMNKLASTRFNLFTLTQKKDDPTLENAVQHIDKIKDIEDEIRNITHELSKETFSKSNSFTSLLTQLIEQQNQLHPTEFNLEIDPKINWDNIVSEIKMNYYRIIQEAIHNTNKYAKATKSTVSLLLEENKLRLSISDNGQGFETNTTKQGIGIQNMHQRITAINGEITINSAI